MIFSGENDKINFKSICTRKEKIECKTIHWLKLEFAHIYIKTEKFIRGIFNFIANLQVLFMFVKNFATKVHCKFFFSASGYFRTALTFRKMKVNEAM